MITVLMLVLHTILWIVLYMIVRRRIKTINRILKNTVKDHQISLDIASLKRTIIGVMLIGYVAIAAAIYYYF